MKFGYGYRGRKCPVNDTRNIAIITNKNNVNAEIRMTNGKPVTVPFANSWVVIVKLDIIPLRYPPAMI